MRSRLSWRDIADGVMSNRAKIGATPTMDIEFAVLQCSQQSLLGDVEEVQPLDAGIGADARLAQALQITLARAGVVQAGQERQVALVAAQQNLAQIDQAVDRLLQRRQLARDVPRPCVPPCGGA